jgi:hypothetical protein
MLLVLLLDKMLKDNALQLFPAVVSFLSKIMLKVSASVDVFDIF